MPNRSVLEQESSDLRKSIANLEAQIKGVREYIAAQERNLRNAAESIRHITERGLAEARSDLHLKEIRLQQLRQDLLTSQAILGKLGEIERKQQDIQTLERERDRIIDLLERAHSDLQRLNNEYLAMTSPTGVSEYALIFAGGQRIVLTTDRSELMVGCADIGVFPDIDLTVFGGTTNGVSRKHAMLRFSHGSWTITDLHSTNGTYVNAVKIAPDAPTLLHDQAKLRFGGVDATFVEQGLPARKTTRLG
jgi:hypothetical protein